MSSTDSQLATTPPPHNHHNLKSQGPLLGVSVRDVAGVALVAACAGGSALGAMVALVIIATLSLLSLLQRAATTLCAVGVVLWCARATSQTCGHTVFAGPLLLALLIVAQSISVSGCARGLAAIRASLQRGWLGYKLLTTACSPPTSGCEEVSADDLSHLATFGSS